MTQPVDPQEVDKVMMEGMITAAFEDVGAIQSFPEESDEQ